jgi:hypothetical protein
MAGKLVAGKFFCFPNLPKLFQLTIQQLEKRQSLNHSVFKFTVLPVVFGDVKGIKCLEDGSLVETMTAKYALKVPGGLVCATLLATGRRIDEAKFKELEDKFEKYFSTIRVVRTQR